MSVSNYSDPDTSSSKSETNIREQASFMERLGSTSWCKCAKCAPMPSGIECQCCKDTVGLVECVAENESYQCIMDHEQFKVVCLNKDILYTALAKHKKRLSCKSTTTQQVNIIMSCNYIKHCVYIIGYTDWQPIYCSFPRHTKNLEKFQKDLLVLLLQYNMNFQKQTTYTLNLKFIVTRELAEICIN